MPLNLENSYLKQINNNTDNSMTEVTDKDLKDCKKFFKILHEPIFKLGTIFRQKDAEAISKLTDIHGDLARIVEVQEKKQDRPYFLEVACACGHTETKETSRAQVLLFLKSAIEGKMSEFYLCDACTNKAKGDADRERHEWEKAMNAKIAEDQVACLEYFKKTFMNQFWKNPIPIQKAFYDMIYGALANIPNSACAYIKTFSYQDFLKTPYWKIVAYRVKHNAGHKCQVCGSAEFLAAHHRTYEFHGREHTKEGLANLTCLCQDCHELYHFQDGELVENK